MDRTCYRRWATTSALICSLMAAWACSKDKSEGDDEGAAGAAGAATGGSAGSGGASTTQTEIELGRSGSNSGGTTGTAVGGAGGATQTTAPSVCGDGKRTGAEACDDANTKDGDGCAANCASIDEDFACPTPGKKCLPISECGDKKITGKENCDDGNELPHDGCSAACLVEEGFTCAFIGIACLPICGDGLVRGSEQCDDGGVAEDDGCTSTCTVQGPLETEANGWVCAAESEDVPSVCARTVCGDGIPEGTEQCDDGNHDLGDGCTSYCRLEPGCDYAAEGCKTACGDGILLDTDVDQECDDGNTSDGDGCSAKCQIEEGYACELQPVQREQLVLPVVYRDFKRTGTENGHPDFQPVSTHQLVPGIVQATLDADKKPVHVAEEIDTTANVYVDGVLEGPDYFSYWYRDDADTETSYNKTIVQTMTFDATAAGYTYANTSFFPLDGLGWDDSAEDRDGVPHNFLFTSEVRYWFRYQGGESLEFIGDDDVWVYVNGRLTVDLGGIHGARAGRVVLDAEGNGTVTECADGDDLEACDEPVEDTLPLTMTVGNVYEIAVFQAERNPTESNYKLTLGSFETARSVCSSVCGDGIQTPDEACDLGKKKNTGKYGTCTEDCKLPAFCGDAHVDADDGEECDDGVNLATYGYNGKPACNANCKWTHYCGDKAVDSLYGEECDDGNDKPDDSCANNCTHRVNCGDKHVDKEVGEECDDGNTESGDGCSEFCTIEETVY